MTINEQAAQPRHTDTPHTETTAVRAAVALGATAVFAISWLLGVLGEGRYFPAVGWAAADAAWVAFLVSWPVTWVAGAMVWEQGNLRHNRRDRRAGLVAISLTPVFVATWLLVSWI